MALQVVCSQFKRWQKEVWMIMNKYKMNQIRDRKITERTHNCVIQKKQSSYISSNKKVIMRLVQQLFVASGVVGKNSPKNRVKMAKVYTGQRIQHICLRAHTRSIKMRTPGYSESPP